MYQRYDWSLWKELGGEEPPYINHSKGVNGKEEIQIFVDADFFHKWKDFNDESLKAVKAHLLRHDPLHPDRYTRKPYATPIATRPAFLIEVCESERFDILWVNAAVKNEAEFEAVKAAGNLKRQEVRNAIERFGFPLWRSQVDFDAVAYPSSKNDPSDDAVHSLLKRNGIR